MIHFFPDSTSLSPLDLGCLRGQCPKHSNISKLEATKKHKINTNRTRVVSDLVVGAILQDHDGAHIHAAYVAEALREGERGDSQQSPHRKAANKQTRGRSGRRPKTDKICFPQARITLGHDVTTTSWVVPHRKYCSAFSQKRRQHFSIAI